MSATVFLSMGLFVDTSGRRSIVRLEGRVKSGRMDMQRDVLTLQGF